jgi:GTP diphosphokinase / guanosine-3',5'-bis(diphosphate) 3'-diphosphatase
MVDKNVFDDEDVKRISEEYELLMNNLYRCDKAGDREMIEKAFKIANEAHWNMRRKSGEPYVIHPIAVARIVNQEIGLGAKSITAALLHDVVEDTEATLKDIEKEFGEKIASLIDGLTKISGTYNKENSSLQAENFRRMLLTISDDIRVILIKIADRLHNMRTLDSMPEHKKMKVAGETIYMYAPLAHRLGLYAIKTELEDLSLKYRHPRIYDEIAKKIRHGEKKNLALINKFALPIIEKLTEAGYGFDISGRPKSIYSVWKKMQAKNVPFEEIYDILAVRIVFEPLPGIPEKTQCWDIFSIITDYYPSKPDRLRDWVNRPKPNGYEALHLTVMGPEGKWVEVQIRSRRMDEIAERGYAAHWRYKGEPARENELDKWIKKIRIMLENPLEDPIEFLDEFKMNLFSTEIMVFTPKGYLINMPKGSTALDFAYEIHTEIGNKAIGAKVNYKLQPLNSVLQSGDQVEIITSDIAKPEKEWLSYVHTAKAKTAISDALKSETKDRLQKGKEMLEKRLTELGIQPGSGVFKKLLPAYEVLNKDELYSKIGLGIINLDNLKKIVRQNPTQKLIKYWELRFAGSKREQTRKETEEKEQKKQPVIDKKVPFLLRESLDNNQPSYEIARCCNPIPGDEVIGYIGTGESILIHKPRCPVAIRLLSNEGDKIIAVKWTIHKLVSFLARIKMTGIDRIGLASEITHIISHELNVNMRNINISVNNGIFEGVIDLYVHHSNDLNNLILKISNIKGLESVSRVEEYTE